MGAATEYENLSIIIPAKNEAAVIADVVSAVRRIYQSAEIVVVDDGSRNRRAPESLAIPPRLEMAPL